MPGGQMIKLYNAKDKIIFFLLSFFTILALNINLSAKGISADIIDETFGWAGGGINPSGLI